MIAPPPGIATREENGRMHKKWALWFVYAAAHNAATFAAKQRLFEIAKGFEEIADFIAEEMKQVPDPHVDHPPLSVA